MRALRFFCWWAGWPVRALLVVALRVYRVTLSPVLGAQCRFHPSCSVYAEEAIRNCGAVRGVALTVWRVARCSPLSRGGVDYPPAGRWRRVYDTDIHQGQEASPRAAMEVPA
jgi:putative membrane protein insertion efficiency factor